jgi:hypothetical protein
VDLDIVDFDNIFEQLKKSLEVFFARKNPALGACTVHYIEEGKVTTFLKGLHKADLPETF